MSKYAANITVDWGRLAGEDDADEQLADDTPADPSATADVAVTETSATVGWRVTIDQTPIEISVRAAGASKAKSVQVSAAVAKQIQAALVARASSTGNSIARTALSMLVPPQARAAVKAASVVVGLVKSGQLRSVLGRLRGGARVLGRLLS